MAEIHKVKGCNYRNGNCYTYHQGCADPSQKDIKNYNSKYDSYYKCIFYLTDSIINICPLIEDLDELIPGKGSAQISKSLVEAFNGIDSVEFRLFVDRKPYASLPIDCDYVLRILVCENNFCNISEIDWNPFA